MRRFLILLPVLLAGMAIGQNLTTVTGTNITDQTGQTKLPAGRICFLATNAADQPISFQMGGGGQVIKVPSCATVTAGVIGTLTVPNPALTSPANIAYRVTVTDASGTEVLKYTGVQFTGTAFNFDTYVPPVGTIVLGVSVPNLAVGNLQVTTCTGCSDPAAELTTHKNQPSGYAGLNASSKLDGTQQVYGTTANTAAQGNDSRFAAAEQTANKDTASGYAGLTAGKVALGEIPIIPLATQVSGVLPAAQDTEIDPNAGDIGFVTPYWNGGITTVVVGGANRIDVMQVSVLRKFTAAKVVFAIGTVSAGSTVDMGMYDMAGNLLWSMGGQSGAVSGTFQASITPVTVNPGNYLLAWTASDNTVSLVSWASQASLGGMWNINANKRLGLSSTAATAGVLPATIGVGANISSNSSLAPVVVTVGR